MWTVRTQAKRFQRGRSGGCSSESWIFAKNVAIFALVLDICLKLIEKFWINVIGRRDAKTAWYWLCCVTISYHFHTDLQRKGQARQRETQNVEFAETRTPENEMLKLNPVLKKIKHLKNVWCYMDKRDWSPCGKNFLPQLILWKQKHLLDFLSLNNNRKLRQI